MIGDQQIAVAHFPIAIARDCAENGQLQGARHFFGGAERIVEVFEHQRDAVRENRAEQPRTNRRANRPNIN